MRTPLQIVMAGLDPAILAGKVAVKVEKPWITGSSPVMTVFRDGS